MPSHQKRIEQVLDLLINEEHEKASELLHSVIVEKARGMYEELVDEDFGGDAKEDYADEIEADKDEIEAEEIYDEEDTEDDESDDNGDEDYEADDNGEEDEDEEVQDRVEDLETQLADLRAEFDALVGDEAGAEEVDADAEDAGPDVDDEGFGDYEDDDYEEEVVGGMEEEDYDDVDEATKFQDEFSGNPLGKEGQRTGTGKNSPSGSTNTQSQFTKAPRKADHGGDAHEIGRGGDESGKKFGQGKDHTPEDNVDVPQKKQKGTANRSDDKSDTDAKSTLGSKGAPRGA